ncbi:MAG: sigma-54 interaction domain-containing protein [Thermodesulfobacteriota bacterium]
MNSRNNRFYISLYIIIPIIIGGLCIISALVSYRLTEYFMKQGLAAGNAVAFWILIISPVAFLCGFVLVWFLLSPAQNFIAHANRIPAVSSRKQEIEPERKLSELAHMEHIFHTVTDVLSKVDARQSFPEIVGESRAVRGVLSQIVKVAPTESTVLIMGESGTGKELAAVSIHKHGSRKDKPFITLNCAAIPGELLESELFGHEKGAFTGAASRRPGKFELAHTGTIFLDEIGDMPLALQAKILRVLQEKEFDRVGGSRPVRVDVRIIAATNKNLSKMVAEGSFREDLYYRLNVFRLQLPPLRERREDIPLLVQMVIRGTSKPELVVTPEAMRRFMEYSWPGNIRELQNVVERAAVLCDDRIDIAHLTPPLTGPGTGTRLPLPMGTDSSIDDYLHEMEKQLIVEALRQVRGVQVEAAKLLKINPRSLWHRVKKHHIEVALIKNDK